jgi:flavin reductase ActVB
MMLATDNPHPPASAATPVLAANAYRDALRHFPSGVTIVTIRAGREVHGLTVSAFTSVSAEPPMILVVVNTANRAHAMLERPDAAFAVNILGDHQQELSNRFARPGTGDRFASGCWGEAATGAPVLQDALAWLDCEVVSRTPAGSHTVYLGRVRAIGVPRADGSPLIYWNRGYRQLPAATPPLAPPAALRS